MLSCARPVPHAHGRRRTRHFLNSDTKRIPRAGRLAVSPRWSHVGYCACSQWAHLPQSRVAQCTRTMWLPNSAMLPLLFSNAFTHMIGLDSGGDFHVAVNGSSAAVFNNEEFTAPRSSLGIGGLDEAHAVSTGLLCMPRRSYDGFVNRHGCHRFSSEQLGLTERNQAQSSLIFARGAMRSNEAQTRSTPRAPIKYERMGQCKWEQAS